MMDRNKLDNLWTASMKLAEGYWDMWKAWAENASLWQEKERQLLNIYMQGSKDLLDEQKKWFDAAIMQASKGQEQMQMIMKEAFLTVMENIADTSYNPWLMMWNNWQGVYQKVQK